MKLDILPGQSYPLGATLTPDGVNFCVFSKNCHALELLLYDTPTAPLPSHVIQLDSHENRTFYYWHVFVRGLQAGQLYGYRVHGPYDPSHGHRFDGSKVLLDPYARAVAPNPHYSRAAAAQPGDNSATALKAVVVNTQDYDWQGDTPLGLPYASAIIYELHVGGFTRSPSSGVTPDKRGTFSGLVEKIPYLKDLGITTLELLPVQQFDEQDAPHNLLNYWGYSPIAFFAPHNAYAANPAAPHAVVNEFRDMVKAFHRAGIEVILDVVFNHTAEGDQTGPTLSLRGFENRAYYILDPADEALYPNYSGCGNSLNANQSIVRRMIIDCLRYWVMEMHVDGFRFDLASVLSRDEWGQPLRSPPILWEIESDPVLAGTKIIAEAWDAVGLYQVGTFIGHRWAEWNGRFRDDVRRFVKGDNAAVQSLAARISASGDLYAQPDRDPNRSINFITCHDGFTLNDLVSYNHKHNDANRESNRDGASDNQSWNCGVEGPTDDPAVEALRLRQIKNLLSILLISQGTPMLSMGDEVRRTQHGNNNAYCHNNELTWFDWTLVDRNQGLLRFTRLLIQFVQSYPIFQTEHFWTTTDGSAAPHLIWQGVRLGQPDWSDESHTLAFTLHDPLQDIHFHIMLNAYWEPLAFQIPYLLAPRRWRQIINTAQPSPADFYEPAAAPTIDDDHYQVAARTTVLLQAY